MYNAILLTLIQVLAELPSHTKEEVRAYISRAEVEHELPGKLLEAVCTVESQLNSKALNINDGGKNNHAIGLCQLLVQTAYWRTRWKVDLKDCRDISGKNFKECKLWDPKLNTQIAGEYLAYLIKKHKGNLTLAVAAYNSGTPKYNNQGNLINLRYVNKVLKTWSEIRR